MEKSGSKSSQKQRVPPRRGQVKMRVLKFMVKSAVELVSLGGRSGSKHTNGGSSTSTSTPSLATPSGYDSGADSDS
ncbi:hypothetical protein CQW23_15967 [Capsicum baccatum]|uniref:Uncharacterized protein n=1 Tax=Capsicum baccatum TaxID=33114 RepID=A0A2G2WNQ9_CAPBA|nr:hypothetical protein CQW23_15967 [Capsicum baccatum]